MGRKATGRKVEKRRPPRLRRFRFCSPPPGSEHSLSATYKPPSLPRREKNSPAPSSSLSLCHCALDLSVSVVLVSNLNVQEVDSSAPDGIRLKAHHYSDREPWEYLRGFRDSDYDLHWESRRSTTARGLPEGANARRHTCLPHFSWLSPHENRCVCKHASPPRPSRKNRGKSRELSSVGGHGSPPSGARPLVYLFNLPAACRTDGRAGNQDASRASRGPPEGFRRNQGGDGGAEG